METGLGVEPSGDAIRAAQQVCSPREARPPLPAGGNSIKLQTTEMLPGQPRDPPAQRGVCVRCAIGLPGEADKDEIAEMIQILRRHGERLLGNAADAGAVEELNQHHAWLDRMAALAAEGNAPCVECEPRSEARAVATFRRKKSKDGV